MFHYWWKNLISKKTLIKHKNLILLLGLVFIDLLIAGIVQSATIANPAAIDGSFNIGGHNCQYDGAFVYQYTAKDDGKSFLLNYTLEYKTDNTCGPGDCFVNDKCYPSGSCVVRGVSCLAGSLVNSCGNGFLESDCGEECDGNLGLENLCTINFGSHNWYKPVTGTCSANCELQTTEALIVDQCGGYCGDGIIQKDAGETCDNAGAYCINCRCVPNCNGRCGGVSDGCGGKCTNLCPVGQTCQENRCVTDYCTAHCIGKCGTYHVPGMDPASAQSTCNCGVCSSDNDCINNICKAAPVAPSCVPSCQKTDGTLKQCGSDGCGGICGICGISKSCNSQTGMCDIDCKSTCITYDANKQIYPCGYDGCFNSTGCYTAGNVTKTCQGYNGSNSKPLGAAWACNPLLGRCTCTLKADDPGACFDKCAGYDACNKPCTFQCQEGPCNTGGTKKTDALLDRCLTCADYCKVWKGLADTSNCYDYKFIDFTPQTEDFMLTLFVKQSQVNSGIRFADLVDRNRFYPYIVDKTGDVDPCSLSHGGCANPPADSYKVLVRVPPNISGMHMLYNVNNVIGNLAPLPEFNYSPKEATKKGNPFKISYARDKDAVFELFDDFDSGLDPSRWKAYTSAGSDYAWWVLMEEGTGCYWTSPGGGVGIDKSWLHNTNQTGIQGVSACANYGSLKIDANTHHDHESSCDEHTTHGVWDHSQAEQYYFGIQTKKALAGKYVVASRFSLPTLTSHYPDSRLRRNCHFTIGKSEVWCANGRYGWENFYDTVNLGNGDYLNFAFHQNIYCDDHDTRWQARYDWIKVRKFPDIMGTVREPDPCTPVGNVPPEVSIWAEYNGQQVTQVPVGATNVIIHWDSKDADKCTAVSGSGLSTGDVTTGFDGVDAINADTDFTISCSSLSGTTQATVSIIVLKYTCDENKVCGLDVAGGYSSLSGCQADCIPSIVKNGSACSKVRQNGFDYPNEDNVYINCANLDDISSVADTSSILNLTPGAQYKIFTDNSQSGLLSYRDFNVIYDLSVPSNGHYTLTLNASNSGKHTENQSLFTGDDFSAVTYDSIGWLFNLYNTFTGYVNGAYYMCVDTDNINQASYANQVDCESAGFAWKRFIDLPELGPNLYVGDFANFIFSVYVDGETAADRKGFIYVPITNTVSTPTIDLGQLSAGSHQIILHYINNHSADFGQTVDPAATSDILNNLQTADLNRDNGSKDYLIGAPIIFSVTLDKTPNIQ